MDMNSTKSRRLTIDALVIVFGISAWISINGLWVELPLLVDALPEGWNLPSYLVMISQLANLGPLIFGILQKSFPNRVNETNASSFILVQGIISSFLLIFFWDSTAVVHGENHSVGLFVILFFLGMVDCTSSVTFLPFMGLFKAKYLTSYLIGEGLSGFLPGIVALGQGVGGNPDCKNVTTINVTEDGNFTVWHLEAVHEEARFSVTAFFSFIMVMMVASCIAFIPLNVLRVSKEERHNDNETRRNSYKSIAVSSIDQIVEPSPTISREDSLPEIFSSKMQHGQMKPFTYWYLLGIQTFLSLLIFGCLFSIQSYSCLPYGNLAYHLTVTLTNMVNPLACFIALFITPLNVKIVTIHSVMSTLIGVYILVLAALSPTPPLADSGWGTALVIIAWVSCIGLSTYAKAGIANIMRTQGSRALFWVGAFTQIGALVGAIISFLLVNVYEVFESYYPCS